MPKKIDMKTRFWSKVKIAGEDNCWEWLGTIDHSRPKHAIALFCINGKNERAHRVMFRFVKGEIPEGKFICHTCDNGKCVNPDHLFIGDALANNQDCWSKGRHPIISGDNDPKSKLNSKQVLEIVRLYKSGNYSQVGLGQMYGVSRSTILAILRGDTWRRTTNITKPLNLFNSGYRIQLDRRYR